MDFKRSSNTDYMFGLLTSPKITELSGGKIPQMTPQQAAGMIGSWIVETGDPSLQNLDVVEVVAGKGRGLSQYTGSRRVPYDIQRADAIKAGQNPNSAKWQMQYFADEYAGKYDQNGRSLSGYTRIFERAPKGQTPAQYAEYYTGSADSGRGYFRPSVPHTKQRQKAAEMVFDTYTGPKTPTAPVKPITEAPRAPSQPVAPINQFQPGIQAPKNLFQNLTIPFQ